MFKLCIKVLLFHNFLCSTELLAYCNWFSQYKNSVCRLSYCFLIYKKEEDLLLLETHTTYM